MDLRLLALLIVVPLVLVAVAALLVLERRRRARRVGVAPRHPVVLLHGILGFDELALFGRRFEYFRGITRRLEEHGVVVHRPQLPPTASVEERARAVCDFVRSLAAPKVNIIAHSMGGLDARFAISRLGLGDRVASLVTIGTPHHGTPLAELADLRALALLRRLARAAGVSLDGFASFSGARMARFNEEVRDDARVRYGSVVARLPSRGGSAHPLLVPTRRFLNRRSGDNDGLVPAVSQRWGELVLEVDADHWAQVGWSRSYDAVALYVKVLQHLRRQGC